MVKIPPATESQLQKFVARGIQQLKPKEDDDSPKESDSESTPSDEK
jgi:hypothetical protein